MDFPDELELLEAESHFHDDYDTFLDLPTPDSYPPEHDETLPINTTTHNQNPQSPPSKRALPNGSVSPVAKRTRTDDPDDAWVPPPPPEPEVSVEAEAELDEEKVVSRFASEIDGDFVTVTDSNGDRVYVKICRVETESRNERLDVKSLSRNEGLISEPVNLLLHKVEQEAFTKALQASSKGQVDVVSPELPPVHEQLWVEKYAPSTFTELLSDEHTNREVLLWLKQWDSCVFGSQIRSTSDDVLSSLRRHSSVTQHQRVSNTNFMRKNRGPNRGNENTTDSHKLNHENGKKKDIHDILQKKTRQKGPPEYKILLLCGPPGLGKTTLAHVAAKHCGYRVVEINASDDRSSSTIQAKILDVVQMNSVTADSRPKCLVIDEIDGALGDGKGAVEVILKMVSAERKSDTRKENMTIEERTGRMSKKGRKTASLSRPVICICNDLYAPALRPLRQVAKVHTFVQPTISRVVSRLKYICNKEQMKTSSFALSALAEYTECDIRSCLNTLQFLNKKNETLNMMEISSQVIGKKDMSKSVFDVWKEIFQIRKVKQNSSSRNCSSVSNEFESLQSLISNRGDYNTIMDGIHENILHLHYHDPLLEKTVRSFDDLGNSDLMHQYIMRTQQMPLLVYQPATAISIHYQVAQVQRPNIEWPKSYHRYWITLTENIDILRSWQCSIPPYISRHLSIKSFVEDLVSPLLHILSPATLRPVAQQLLTEREMNDLSHLVSTMVSYSLSYKHAKSEHQPNNAVPELALDASHLALDPPISDFIKFKDYRCAHFVLASAMKQVLVHEVEKERILQMSTARSANSSKEYQVLRKEECTSKEFSQRNNAGFFAQSKAKNSNNIVQHNQITSKVIPTTDSSKNAAFSMRHKSTGGTKKSSIGSKDFFERFRKSSDKRSQSTDTAAQKRASEKVLHPLLFKFNEGFTNAIKRPVRMREFLV